MNFTALHSYSQYTSGISRTIGKTGNIPLNLFNSWAKRYANPSNEFYLIGARSAYKWRIPRRLIRGVSRVWHPLDESAFVNKTRLCDISSNLWISSCGSSPSEPRQPSWAWFFLSATFHHLACISVHNMNRKTNCFIQAMLNFSVINSKFRTDGIWLKVDFQTIFHTSSIVICMA
jgi:hypothetical protein